jgi:hypothetical protein
MRIKNKYLVGHECTYDIPDDENPTVVASALKTYLFEMPVPLIPSTMWYKLIAITDDRNFWLGASYSNSPLRLFVTIFFFFSLADALELVSSLPSDHTPILFYVLDFLAEVAQVCVCVWSC